MHVDVDVYRKTTNPIQKAITHMAKKIETEGSFTGKVKNCYTVEHFKKQHALLVKFDIETECGHEGTIALEVSDDYQPFGNPPKKYVDATIEEVLAIFGVNMKESGIGGLEAVIGRKVDIYSKFSTSVNKNGDKYLNIYFSREKKVSLTQANALFTQLLSGSGSAAPAAATAEKPEIEAF